MLKETGMVTRVKRPPEAIVSTYRQVHLAPERYVEAGAEAVPASRVRLVSDTIEERWEAVPKKYEGSPAQIMAAVMADGGVPKMTGWKVTQHVRHTPTPFSLMSPDEVREHVMSLQIAPEDEARYAGYYPTIKGNDVAHHDPTQIGMRAFQGGQVLRGEATSTHDGVIRGGTEIRSRAHLKRVMKERGYEHWDKGWQRETDRIETRKKAAMKAKHEIIREKADKALPRLLGEI